MSEEAVVKKLPKCDFCEEQAAYDFKTLMGPWAYGCLAHWSLYRFHETLGTGKGQHLKTRAEVKHERQAQTDPVSGHAR